jgi:hypothetical protein
LDDISYEWLEKCENVKELERGVKLIEEDGNYFYDLKNRILEKIKKIKGDVSEKKIDQEAFE